MSRVTKKEGPALDKTRYVLICFGLSVVIVFYIALRGLFFQQ